MRPIVLFAWENALILRARQERLDRQKVCWLFFYYLFIIFYLSFLYISQLFRQQNNF